MWLLIRTRTASASMREFIRATDKFTPPQAYVLGAASRDQADWRQGLGPGLGTSGFDPDVDWPGVPSSRWPILCMWCVGVDRHQYAETRHDEQTARLAAAARVVLAAAPAYSMLVGSGDSVADGHGNPTVHVPVSNTRFRAGLGPTAW